MGIGIPGGLSFCFSKNIINLIEAVVSIGLRNAVIPIRKNNVPEFVNINLNC